MTKILLVTPKLSIPGGVTEYNRMLLSYSKNEISVFNLLGSSEKKYTFLKHFYFGLNLVRFILILLYTRAKIIHLGPSLGINAIKRDGLFCFVAKLFGKEVFIQWHGWNPNNEYLMIDPHNRFFKNAIFKSDHIRFLSSSFAIFFSELGYKNQNSIGTTFIDDALLKEYIPVKKNNENINILFLSTISKNKGIYMAIELFSELVKEYKITLTIAGNGPELENIKSLITHDFSNRINFTGHITGKQKIEAYKNADIYLFPSQYEGMPTSVLEAMGFGLPVICSNVGALPDFFKNDKMGYMLDKDDKESFKNALLKLINDKSKREIMGSYNHEYAINNFLASRAVSKIDNIYNDLV